MRVQKDYITQVVSMKFLNNVYEITLANEPNSEMGYLLFDKNGVNEEEMFYHQKVGSTVYVYPINRKLTVEHTNGTPVMLANSISYFNHLLDAIGNLLFLYKTDMNNVVITGGTTTVKGELIEIPNLDTREDGYHLFSGKRNYIYIIDGKWVISDKINKEHLLFYVINTDVSGMITNIIRIHNIEKPTRTEHINSAPGTGGGDMFKNIYDTDNDNQIDIAERALISDFVRWSGVTNIPSEVLNLKSTLEQINTQINSKVDSQYVTNKINEAKINSGSGNSVDLSSYVTTSSLTTELNNYLRKNDLQTQIQNAISSGNITGLEEKLNAKANTNHTHVIDHVTGLQDALNNKAAATHTHNISDVSHLQDRLNNKANVNGSNTFQGVQNLKPETNSPDGYPLVTDALVESKYMRVKVLNNESEYTSIGVKDPGTIYLIKQQ